MFPYRGMAALLYPPINNERTTIMAIKLIANYSKRLGLPGYSSHQFEVSIETEITHTSELAAETERLYGPSDCRRCSNPTSRIRPRRTLRLTNCSNVCSRGFQSTDDIHIIRETNAACKRSRDLCCNRSRMEMLGKATVSHPGTGRKGRVG